MEWSVHSCGCVSIQISYPAQLFPDPCPPLSCPSNSGIDATAVGCPCTLLLLCSEHHFIQQRLNQPNAGSALEPENGKLAVAIIPQVSKSSASICRALVLCWAQGPSASRQSWDDSGRAVKLESSPSCLSSSSEQNKHFKRGLLFISWLLH